MVCFLDADGSLDPRQLPAGRGRGRWPAGPIWCWAAAARPVAGPGRCTPGSATRPSPGGCAGWSGCRVHDLGPMRAARREALLGLDLTDRRFGYPLEMVLKAGRAGWRVSEVDVDYAPRAGGRSKVTGTVRGTAARGPRHGAGAGPMSACPAPAGASPRRRCRGGSRPGSVHRVRRSRRRAIAAAALADTLDAVVGRTPAARRTLVVERRLSRPRPAGTVVRAARRRAGRAAGQRVRRHRGPRTAEPAGRHGHPAAHPGPAGRWCRPGWTRPTRSSRRRATAAGGRWRCATRRHGRVLAGRTDVHIGHRCAAPRPRCAGWDCPLRRGPVLRDVDTAADARAVAALCPAVPVRRRRRPAPAVHVWTISAGAASVTAPLALYGAALRRAAGGSSAPLDLVRSSAARPGGRLDAAAWSATCARATAALLDRCRGATLDVGCGPGRLAAALRAPGSRALGVDISPEAVRQTRRRGARRRARVTSSRRCRARAAGAASCSPTATSASAATRNGCCAAAPTCSHRRGRGPGRGAAAGGAQLAGRGRAAPGRPDQRAVPVGRRRRARRGRPGPPVGPAGAAAVDGGGPVVRRPRRRATDPGSLRPPAAGAARRAAPGTVAPAGVHLPAPLARG